MRIPSTRKRSKTVATDLGFNVVLIISSPDAGGYLILAVHAPKFIKFRRTALAQLIQPRFKLAAMKRELFE